jgi:hypothetical protein
MKRIILLMALMALLLSACAPSCASQSEDYFTQANDLADDYLRTVEVANSTSRIALAPMVTKLSDIEKDIEGLEPPECAATAHKNLVRATKFGVDAFLSFMSEDSDAMIQSSFQNFQYNMDAYTKERDKILSEE